MMNRLLKILVVDDKDSIIEIVKLYVGKRASVIGVSSPDSALEFLKSEDFDVARSRPGRRIGIFGRSDSSWAPRKTDFIRESNLFLFFPPLADVLPDLG